MGYPPWHMWGNSQTLQLTAAAGAQPPTPVTQQLARIAYGRPETWRFLFWGDLLTHSVAAGGGGISLDFDLIVGIGRTQKKLKSFCTLGFDIPNNDPSFNKLRWSTITKTPGFNEADTAERETDLFIAQDIQCVAAVTFFASSLTTIQLEIGCMFSPNVHLRPEWMQNPDDVRRGVARFRGGEQGGM